jgi:hypothetical protein
MSKIGNYYIEQMERQFGNVIVEANAPCNMCGKRYGDHLGLTCPPKNGTFLKPNKDTMITINKEN